MRSVILTTLIAAAAGQEYRSCGNCRVGGEFDGRCNTGPVDLVPFNTSTAAGLDGNGTSSAEAVTVAEMKSTVGTAWNTMFCGTYLDRYRDGFRSAAGEGAACVRAFDRATILATDKDAKDTFNKFGTTNGYKSSFAVSKGSPDPAGLDLYGTDGTGDVPANWCGVYMREMLCAIAFPQISMNKTVLAARRSAGSFNALSENVDGVLTHYIRPVDQDSCETLFDVCNRREPETDEKKTEFIPQEQQGFRARFLLNGNTGRKLESDAWCGMWKDGFGLASAGTGIAGGDPILEFEAGSHLVYTISTLVVMFVVVLL
eukprot:TRINITY_DN30984_c0_g1_i1.p1 TRINITY_DN30984_c0_g1~~TRINITY_DN30984_c0_g1_i1.p1  ORF type:complete len:315 (+),score=84.47 TRINITY_DN30984_c0_g1_i1:48-992(+)